MISRKLKTEKNQINMRYSLNKVTGKIRYYIEPNGIFGWVFRREGSDKIIKRDKYKQLLLAFAESYCSDGESELMVCDDNGLLQDIINFNNGVSKGLQSLS